MNSLPGGFTSASRFVRVFFEKDVAMANNPPQTFTEAFSLVNSLIGSVTVPFGTTPSGMKGNPDTTRWATVRVTGHVEGDEEETRAEYYIRGYHSMTWRKLDLNEIDFSSNVTLLADPFDDLMIT